MLGWARNLLGVNDFWMLELIYKFFINTSKEQIGVICMIVYKAVNKIKDLQFMELILAIL